MTFREKNRNAASGTLTILGILAMVMFVCRLWPLLLLVLFGMVAVTVRVMVSSVKREPAAAALPLIPAQTEIYKAQDIQTMAYSSLIQQVTALVERDYPEARWVWEAPNTRQRLESGEEVYILLNRAGGYKRAKILVRNYEAVGIEYPIPSRKTQEQDFSDDTADDFSMEPGEPVPENYGLLAFEWADAHIMELNERCNEALGRELPELILTADELPVSDSWPDICNELRRNGLENVQCVPEGIKIKFKQETAERE